MYILYITLKTYELANSLLIDAIAAEIPPKPQPTLPAFDSENTLVCVLHGPSLLAFEF